MEYDLDATGRITAERIVGEEFLPADDVILAIGQENAFPWIERDLGIRFDKWDVPVIDTTTFQSTLPQVFFGGDAAFGPKNIIWAVEHGHQAAISIHRLCHGSSRVLSWRPKGSSCAGIVGMVAPNMATCPGLSTVVSTGRGTYVHPGSSAPIDAGQHPS